MYLDPGRRYVGRGILHNDLNDKMLHGVPLEEGYARIQFEVAEKLEYNTQLPRPCDEANLVGEAPGYFLAWPRKLISMKLEVEYITDSFVRCCGCLFSVQLLFSHLNILYFFQFPRHHKEM